MKQRVICNIFNTNHKLLISSTLPTVTTNANPTKGIKTGRVIHKNILAPELQSNMRLRWLHYFLTNIYLILQENTGISILVR